MSKFLKAILAGSLAIVATLGLFAGTASAQTADDVDYTGAEITVPGGVLGETITADCVGFPANTEVTFALNGRVLGTTTTDANGGCAFTFPSPTDCGTFTLTATAGDLVRTTTFEITGCESGGAAPVRTSGTLPYTGSDSSLPLAQIGVAVLAAGALLTFGVRRVRAKA